MPLRNAGARAAGARGRAVDLRAAHARGRPQALLGLRRRLRRPRRGHQHDHPRAAARSSLSSTRSCATCRPRRSELRRLVPALAAAAAEVAPVAEVQGAAVRRHGRHVRGDRPRPAGAAGDDRGDAAHADRRHRVVPRPDAVPGATSPTSRAACSPAAAELPRSLPPINSALLPACRPSAHPGAAPSDARAAAPGARQPLREPQHAARAARPAPRRAGRRSPRSSTSRPTRRSATTSSTSSTRSARTCPRPSRAALHERIQPKLADLTQANTLGLTESLAAGRRAHQPGPARAAPCRRCTPSTAARRSTPRAGPTARAARPAT